MRKDKLKIEMNKASPSDLVKCLEVIIEDLKKKSVLSKWKMRFELEGKN